MFSNYSVKKILPRLVIVAILVNISFPICAAAVDISNILGASLREFIRNLVIVDQSGYNAAANISGLIIDIVPMVIVTIGAAILVLLNLGTVIIAVLMVFAVLAFREVLVTVLIIISPIAFVLYLLPNTEKWFKKWLTEFARVLFIYPAIAFVWGATELVTYILMKSYAVEHPLMGLIMICLLQVVPVLTIIPIMKMGGQALSQLEGLARKGLEKTPIKDWGNYAGQAVKSRSLQAAQKALGSTRASQYITDEGNMRWDEEEGKFYKIDRNGEKKYLSQTSAMHRRLASAREAAEQGDGAAIAALRRTGRNAFLRTVRSGASKLAGAASGFGDGNYTEFLKTAAESAKSTTQGAQRVEEFKANLTANEFTREAELRKHRHELDLKKRAGVIEQTAAKSVATFQAEVGVMSAEWLAAVRALEMDPTNLGAAMRVNELQAKLADGMEALFENLGQIRAADGSVLQGVRATPLNIIGALKEQGGLKYQDNDMSQESLKAMIAKGDAISPNEEQSILGMLKVFATGAGQATDVDEIQGFIDTFETVFEEGKCGRFEGKREAVVKELENRKILLEDQQRMRNFGQPNNQPDDTSPQP
ncbi:type IV secretion system protein [Candidatus Saccharibacteria bacterium]|nr:type IV secretion system protein [Candidatus Saccharibacteria bacterium]